jgi:hypothetical protein
MTAESDSAYRVEVTTMGGRSHIQELLTARRSGDCAR